MPAHHLIFLPPSTADCCLDTLSLYMDWWDGVCSTIKYIKIISVWLQMVGHPIPYLILTHDERRHPQRKDAPRSNGKGCTSIEWEIQSINIRRPTVGGGPWKHGNGRVGVEMEHPASLSTPHPIHAMCEGRRSSHGAPRHPIPKRDSPSDSTAQRRSGTVLEALESMK